MNSNKKRKVGEREARDFLNTLLGTNGRRSQQYCGSADSADLVGILPNVHWEVKRDERLNVEKAMAQAVRDCGDNLPVVFHRKNRSNWLLTVRGMDLIKLARAVVGQVAKNNAEAQP